MRAFFPSLFAVPSLSILLTTSALAQSGGFVFEETPEPEAIVEAPEEPVDEPAPDPVVAEEEEDTLENFTFGGRDNSGDDAEQTNEERDFWASLRINPTVEGYRQYLEAYPDGEFADAARTEIAAMQAAEDRRQGLIASCDKLAGDPDDPSLSPEVAGIAIADIDPDAALWTCSRARAAEPDSPRLSYNLARIAEAQGQEQSALRGYRIALRLAIERTGEPHLPAAAGILRLAPEPRNPTESMSMFLLQFAVDGAGRLKALQTRVAELEAERAVLSSDSGDADDRIAALQAEIEFLNAREIDLLSTLDTAEAKGAEAESLRAELGTVQASLAEATTALDTVGAERDEAQARIVVLEAELSEVTAALDAGDAGQAERDAEIAALGTKLNEALAQLAAAEQAAPDAGASEEVLAANAALEEKLAAIEADNASLAEQAEILRKQLAEATARLEETRALLNQQQSD